MNNNKDIDHMENRYVLECKLTAGLRDELKQHKMLIAELMGTKKKAGIKINEWYEKLNKAEDARNGVCR